MIVVGTYKIIEILIILRCIYSINYRQVTMGNSDSSGGGGGNDGGSGGGAYSGPGSEGCSDKCQNAQNFADSMCRRDAGDAGSSFAAGGSISDGLACKAAQSNADKTHESCSKQS